MCLDKCDACGAQTVLTAPALLRPERCGTVAAFTRVGPVVEAGLGRMRARCALCHCVRRSGSLPRLWRPLYGLDGDFPSLI